MRSEGVDLYDVLMSWLSERPPKRRPILLVEDHLYHIGETLELFEGQAPEFLPLLTVVCLDRPGPDTERSLSSWLQRFPQVRWALPSATADGHGALKTSQVDRLPVAVFQQQHELGKAIAERLRPGGLLLQDVQLETLAFIAKDRWWQSIYLAASVRGLFGERAPLCRFLSNKKGYEATFGADLLEAGFDPRDVIDKRRLHELLVPTLRSLLDRRFPLRFEVSRADGSADSPGVGASTQTVVGLHSVDRSEVEEDLDLVLWHVEGRPELGGRLVPSRAKKPRLSLKPGSQECETWRALVLDHLAGGPGVPVLEVGARLAPDRAGRAEMTNCAARHIHLMRSRLSSGEAIQTIEHAYRLDRRLRSGFAAERVR